MNDTNPASTDHNQWLQYYQQTTVSDPLAITGDTGLGFSGATTTKVTTSFITNNTSSPSNSTSIGNNIVIDHAHLNPQAVVGKPIRRRSRASRRTPTTLLNASTTNFRSLVQQFTGCQNTKATSLGSQKGPVNLSFGMPPKNQNDHQAVNGTSSRISPLGYEFYNQSAAPIIHQNEEQQWRQQQQNQEMYGKQEFNSNMEITNGGMDEFGIGDVSDLHELMDESSTFNEDNNKDGSYYFR